MTTRASVAILAFTLLVGGLSADDLPPTPSVSATGQSASETGVPWTALRFVARKLLLSARATIEVRVVPASDADGLLLSAPEGTEKPLRTPDLIETRVISDLPFGRGEVTRAWIERNGSVLQSEKLGTGRKQLRKRRRYTTSGYYYWRSEPADARERKLGADQWSHCDARLVDGTAGAAEETVLTSSYALLYLISAARLDRPDTLLRLQVFSGNEPREVEFRAGPLSRLEASFEEVRGVVRTRRSGEVSVREVFGAPVADGGEVGMGIMGMRGPLRILVEEGTGIPLEIRGRVEHLGEVRVRLERAVLADEAGS